MPADVIIDPTNGQIYWNDGTGSPQSISIKGDALNAISFVGYSGSYSPGSAPGGAQTLATFNDASTATLVPGTTNYELGSGTLRWKFYGSTGNFSSNTLSSDLFSGAVIINGGIAISGNASIGQSLLFYNPLGTKYTGFKAQAVTTDTIYSLPSAFPSTGTSVLQSDTTGLMSWVPMTTGSSGSTAANINIVNAASGVFYPLFTNTSTTANGTAGVAVSVDSSLLFDATSNTLIVDGATLGGLGLTTTFASFDFGNTSGIAQTLNFSNTTTGQVLFNFGTNSGSASTATFFGSVNTNRMVLNVNSSGNVHIQTNQVNARVRLFQNNTTGNVSIFGTSGGTLYLGEDSTTNNADIAIRGTVISGGGGNVRAALFTLATATSNGSGVGGTIQFQTSTSGNPTASNSNALRTRLRIEGAATGTSNLESIIGFGDTSSGTAWTSYLRGVDARGSNVEAGEIQIQSGRSTGSGLAQGVSFYVSSSGAGAEVLNTPLQIGRFTGTGLTIYSTTVTTSTTTGALVVAGGVGIGGTLFTDPGKRSSVSGFAISNGVGTGSSIILNSSAVTTNTTTGALIVSGGVGIGGTLFTDASKTSSISGFGFSNGVGTGNSIILNSSAVTTNTTSGALIVTGGVGIGGTLFTDASKTSSISGFGFSNAVGTGNSIILNSSAVTTSTNTGALIVAGGVGIGGTLFTDPSKRSSVSGFAISNGVGTGTSLLLNSSALSNTTTSGTLIVSGGAGIAKSLNIGEGINLWSGANYTGLKSAASTSIQYTLPPTVPSGTGTSFLSASDTGVMAWVAPPAGSGSGSPGGSNRQVQFNDSTAFGGAVGMTWESSTYLLQLNSLNQPNSMAVGLRLENGSATSGPNNTRWSPALEFVGRNGITNQYRNRFTTEVIPSSPDDYRAYLRFKHSLDTGAPSFNNNIFLIHSTLGIGIGASNTTSNNAIFFRAPISLSADKTYILPADLPTTGSVGSSVLSSDTSGNLIWAAMASGSPGGSGTVNAGTAFSTAYYDANGSTVSGTGLLKIIPSGTAISSFADIDMRAGKDIRFWEATDTLYTSISAGTVSQTYDLKLPAAKVGTGFSTIIVDSSGNMSFAPIISGSGVSVITTGFGVTVRNKTPLIITLAAGYTPAIGTTADDVVLRLPESFEDGSSSVNWIPKRAFMRTETPFSGVTLLNIEYFSGVGTFSPTNLLSGAGISLGVSGIAETASTNFSASTFPSGTKLRMNFSQINSQHTDLLIYVQFQEQ